MINNKTKILELVQKCIAENTFVKITLANYKGATAELKKILIRRIIIKKEEQLSFTYRYQTKDTVKNYPITEALNQIKEHINTDGFGLLMLYSTVADWQLQLNPTNKWRLKKLPASITQLPELTHNKTKNRKIETNDKQYLHQLKITDKEGNIYKAAQNKYKQINQYIEILSSLLKKLPNKSLNVVDMGAGKGYLTFALYDYLNNVLNKPATVIGVEYRKNLVNLCSKIADNSRFKNLQFVEGTIEQYENPNIDVLIALHACDTATDDAIKKGIINDAELIVVAPCCHKQIRNEIEKDNVNNDLNFLTKYGIFLERQAEMVTDGIRALILEYYGYSTKVVEFISDAHTPKNVLVMGYKNPNKTVDKAKILEEIKSIKSYFGISYHHLEKEIGLL